MSPMYYVYLSVVLFAIGTATVLTRRNAIIVFMGVEAHNFAPFHDTNPKAKPDERYKAVGGLESKLFGFGSPDGIRWKKIQAEPVTTKGQFDSLNIVFRDEPAKLYRCYSRTWTGDNYTGFRAVQSSTSEDFIHWNDPIPNRHRAARSAINSFSSPSATRPVAANTRQS